MTFKGANVNDQNKDGYSALMGASAMGHFRIVSFLGEKGANITSKNDYQDTSLILAARNNHLPVVQYLVVSLICYYILGTAEPLGLWRHVSTVFWQIG